MRAFIVHGWGGSPEQAWFPWLAERLTARGMEAHILAMPDTEHPQADAWVEHLHQEIGDADAQTVLIGHSCACPAILRYLEELAAGQTIGGAVFVSAFIHDLGPGYEAVHNFVDRPFDWDRIAAACPRMVIINSQDDPSVPITNAFTLHDALPFADLQILRTGGHLGHSDGCTRLPLAEEAVLRIAQGVNREK